MNLVQLVQDQLGPQLERLAGQVPGIGPNKASNAVQAAIPTMLASFLQMSTNPSGASALNSAAERATQQGTDLPTGAALQAAAEQGTASLTSLMGEGRLSGLTSALGNFTGVAPGGVASLIGAAGPILLRFLARQPEASGGGLAAMLAGQKDSIMSAMPSGLSSLLSSSGVLDVVSAARTSGREAAAGMSRGVEDVAAKAGSYAPSVAANAPASVTAAPWFRPAIGIGILVIVALVIWQFIAGRNVQETAQQAAGQAQKAAQQATSAAQQATSAAQSALAMVGNVDLGKEISGSLTQLGTMFGGITDINSAKSAVPQLQDIAGKLDKLKDLAGQLPAAGRSMLADLVAKALPTLRTALDKAYAIPGVPEVLKPAADQLMASLGDLAKAAS
jgi:hypothetical protein